MEGKIPNRVGSGGTGREGFEESIDYVGGGLKGSCGVEGEVATVVGERCFLGKLWRLEVIWR